MPPRPPNSESQELNNWKAREFDKRNLDTQEVLVSKVERIERELAVFKAKLGIVAFLASSAMSLLFHFVLQYLKH
jgi:hypothetical protein